MLDQVNATPTPHKRLPWNKGKLTGASRRYDPSTSGRSGRGSRSRARARDLPMFNLMIDGKLRGSNLAV